MASLQFPSDVLVFSCYNAWALLEPSEEGAMRYVFGNYTLDTLCYELRRAGALIALRPKVFHLLAYLLAHRDRIVPRQELCEHLWPHQFVSDATLDACLAQARQAVGDRGRTQRVIQTRHGYGYRFVAAVEVHDDPLGDGDEVFTAASLYESAKVKPAQGRADTAGVPALVPEVPREAPLPLTSLYPSPLHTAAGERKVVTVLVCTLANAAELAQRLEAEAWHQWMQAFFALVLEEVERYGGTLQRVLDDGALVLFGAPQAQEDHVQRAVLAALALQQRLHASRPEQALSLGEAWAARIGLHTGQLIVGHLGNAGRLTFTSVGDTIHLVAGLAERAAPGTILVSDATARLVQGAVHLEAGPPMLSPGQGRPGRAYKALGLGPRRAPLLRHAMRPLSAFIGRELELATLRALLRRVEGGQGQVVSLVGEPGMGKTRLVYEFWHSLGSTRVTSLEGRCVSYGEAIPYLPVREILRQACGVSEVESPEVTIARVHQHLQELDMAAAEEAPYLLRLLGMPNATAGLAGLSPESIRARTFATLDQLLLRQSQRQPLLVVVENLHWIDPTSQEYLGELVERLAGLPLMLLVTFRPGYRPPWMDKSYATQLTLPQLAHADSQRVVQAVLPAMQLPEHLLQDILAKAAGNPLFLEELAWAVREQGGLQLPSEIPTTVQAVLAARIDRLPPGAKHLLQTAAVIGPEVPRPLLQAVAEMSEDELRLAFRQLQATEFLYETRFVPEGGYTFKHALTHEVAYGSLPQEHRRALHARIMEAIEKRYPDRLADQIERLAHHAFRGEVWGEALAYCRQAGAKAMASSAFREAVACFEPALVALQHLPQSPDTFEQAIDLRFHMSNVLFSLGQFGRVLNTLSEAALHAEALDDRRQEGRVSSLMTEYLWMMGDNDRAVMSGQRALTLANALGDFALQVRTHCFLGQTYHSLGDYPLALDVLSRTVVALEGELISKRLGMPFLPAVFARTWVVFCLAELGAFAEGSTRAAEAVRIAEAVDHPFSRIAAYVGVGHLALGNMDFSRAIPQLEQGLALCRLWHFPIWLPWITSLLGSLYAVSGRLAEALPLLEEAVEQATAMRLMAWQSLWVARLSEAYLRASRIEGAMARAVQALELSRTHKERGHEAYALRLLGDITLLRDPPEVETAEAYFRQALALAEALGMRPLQAHCHLGLGTLYGKLGLREQARAELSTAVELYRAMEMTFWLPQAEAALTRT
jgi:class 3 adenylate cyclase/DNA-binding winged helix-turn-helix (wHTH) protein/tetratricopeptide (TPR) repeat protein